MKFIREHWLALLLGTAAVTGIVFFPPAIVPALIIGVASIPGFSVFGAAAGAVAHGLIAAAGFVASFGIGEAITAAFNAAFGGGSGPRPPAQDEPQSALAGLNETVESISKGMRTLSAQVPADENTASTADDDQETSHGGPLFQPEGSVRSREEFDPDTHTMGI